MNVLNPQPNPVPYSMPRQPFRRTFDVEGQDGAECRSRIWKGQYNCIFIATPPATTAAYLKQLASCPGRIVVWAEKPWFSSMVEALGLESLLAASAHHIRYGDHYLHRPVCRWLWQASLGFLLGGPLTGVEGVLFETPGTLSRAMFTTGVLRDLLIHLVSLVRRLFPGERLEVTHAFAAKQDGWPGASESYASLRGEINNGRMLVPVSLAAAKNHPVARKQLVLHGPQASLLLDFMKPENDKDNESADLIFPGGGYRRLYADPRTLANSVKPYGFVLQHLIEGRGETLGLDFHEALDVLRVLDDAVRLFLNPLPTYEQGTYPPDAQGSSPCS
jgi:predicted dehydrogenase